MNVDFQFFLIYILIAEAILTGHTLEIDFFIGAYGYSCGILLELYSLCTGCRRIQIEVNSKN